MWDEAKAAFSGGNMADAMAKAKTVKEKAVEVMTTLGMQVPAAAAPRPHLRQHLHRRPNTEAGQLKNGTSLKL